MRIGLEEFKLGKVEDDLGDLRLYIDSKEKLLEKVYIIEFIFSIILLLITMW